MSLEFIMLSDDLPSFRMPTIAEHVIPSGCPTPPSNLESLPPRPGEFQWKLPFGTYLAKHYNGDVCVLEVTDSGYYVAGSDETFDDSDFYEVERLAATGEVIKLPIEG
jgi:hypothetical protein